MTIHQQKEPLLPLDQPTSESPNPNSGKSNKSSVSNPFIYCLILFGVILRPEWLRSYRSQLNSTEQLHLQKQAFRTAVTLLWIPLFTIFILIWASGLVPLHPETAAFFIGTALFSCIATYRHAFNGTLENKNSTLLGSMLSLFGLMAMLFHGIYNGAEGGQTAVFLILLILIFSLLALCIAMVFKLQTLDALSGIVALLTVGGISIAMSQVMSSIWLPVIIILLLILGVGIIEERHDLHRSKNRQPNP